MRDDLSRDIFKRRRRPYISDVAGEKEAADSGEKCISRGCVRAGTRGEIMRRGW